MRASSLRMTEVRARTPRRATNNQPLATAPPGTYKLFFSHKTQDHPVIKSIITLIQNNTENVRCFVSEDIEKGIDWQKAIAEALAASSSLVLVFTDPDVDWGWCLYETGFFHALTTIRRTAETRRIYCLHNASNSPPSPIRNLQSIPAVPDEVSKWLKDNLYKVTNQPEYRFDNIPEVADKICKFFVIPRTPIYSARSINISVDSALLISPDDLPEDTIVADDGRVWEELFGTQKTKLPWQLVKERFRARPLTSEANLNTMKEISRAVYRVCNQDRLIPVQGTIFVGDGPKRYRPVISHAEKSSTGIVSCEILLVDDVGGQLQNVEKGLGALLIAIRMAVRIRWEIIRPFILDINIKDLADFAPRKLRFDLQTCFSNIFLEAEFRGNYAEADVIAAFENEIDKTKIITMISNFPDTYAKIWQSLGFTNVTQTFGEVSDQPFLSQDIDLLKAGLQGLAKMNEDFLDIAVARARALIQKNLGMCRESNGEAETGRPGIGGVLERWNTYLPYGVFRIRWTQKRYKSGYDPADMVGEPTVTSGNPAFLALFQLAGDHVPDPDGEEPLTLPALMERIREFSSEEDFAAFESDQKRVVDKIIMRDGIGQVSVAMRLSYPEGQHRTRTFLPLLVAKRTDRSPNRPLDMYLLVAYVETSADSGSF